MIRVSNRLYPRTTTDGYLARRRERTPYFQYLQDMSYERASRFDSIFLSAFEKDIVSEAKRLNTTDIDLVTPLTTEILERNFPAPEVFEYKREYIGNYKFGKYEGPFKTSLRNVKVSSWKKTFEYFPNIQGKTMEDLYSQFTEIVKTLRKSNPEAVFRIYIRGYNQIYTYKRPTKDERLTIAKTLGVELDEIAEYVVLPAISQEIAHPSETASLIMGIPVFNSKPGDDVYDQIKQAISSKLGSSETEWSEKFFEGYDENEAFDERYLWAIEVQVYQGGCSTNKKIESIPHPRLESFTVDLLAPKSSNSNCLFVCIYANGLASSNGGKFTSETRKKYGCKPGTDIPFHIARQIFSDLNFPLYTWEEFGELDPEIVRKGSVICFNSHYYVYMGSRLSKHRIVFHDKPFQYRGRELDTFEAKMEALFDKKVGNEIIEDLKARKDFIDFWTRFCEYYEQLHSKPYKDRGQLLLRMFSERCEKCHCYCGKNHVCKLVCPDCERKYLVGEAHICAKSTERDRKYQTYRIDYKLIPATFDYETRLDLENGYKLPSCLQAYPLVPVMLSFASLPEAGAEHFEVANSFVLTAPLEKGADEDFEKVNREFLEFLISEEENGRYYAIASHNGSGFDMPILHGYLLANLEKYSRYVSLTGKDSSVIIHDGRVIRIQFGKHYFYDSGRHLNGSLDSICNSYKVPSEYRKKCVLKVDGKEINATDIFLYEQFNLTPNQFIEKIKETGMYDALVEYCLYDSISLLYVLWVYERQLHKIYQAMGFPPSHHQYSIQLGAKPTLPGIALKTFTNFCVKNKIYGLDKNDPLFQALASYAERAKIGGASYINEEHAGVHLHAVYKADVKRLYGEAMQRFKFMSGKISYTTSYLPGKLGFYKIKSLSQVVSAPLDIPHKSKGALDWTRDWDENSQISCISSVDLERVIRNGGHVEIVDGYVSSDSIYLFKDFAEIIHYETLLQDFYKLMLAKVKTCKTENEFFKYLNIYRDPRRELGSNFSESQYSNATYPKIEGSTLAEIRKELEFKFNPVYRETLKLFGNALFGKCLQLIMNKILHGPFKLHSEWQELIVPGSDYRTSVDEFGVWLTETFDADPPALYPQGCLILSYSKDILFKNLSELGREYVYNLETDGWAFPETKETLQYVRKHQNEDLTLGGIVFEHRCDYFEYYQKKFYRFVDERKMFTVAKGIPQKQVNLNKLFADLRYNGVAVSQAMDPNKPLFQFRRNLRSRNGIHYYSVKKTIKSNLKFKRFIDHGVEEDSDYFNAFLKEMRRINF